MADHDGPQYMLDADDHSATIECPCCGVILDVYLEEWSVRITDYASAGIHCPSISIEEWNKIVD